MRSRTRIACCAVIFLFPVPLVAGAQDEPTASLPLEEVLRLYKENEESQREEKVDPPFAATVNKMELFGRLLEGGIELLWGTGATQLPEPQFALGDIVVRIENPEGGSSVDILGVLITRNREREGVDPFLIEPA